MSAGAVAATIAALALATPATAATWAPPPANAKFDYQIGGDYPLPRGVSVVSRDWFSGSADARAYSICYVNAFQTQNDEDSVDRPDEKANWPRDLVLEELGDDPNWGGEYLVDLSRANQAGAGSGVGAADDPDLRGQGLQGGRVRQPRLVDAL